MAKVLELQLQHQSFQWIFRIDFFQDWLVWSPCSPRDSQESSLAPEFENISSLVLNLLHGPALTSLHDYWKNLSWTIWTFVCKVMSLLFDILSRLVIAFLQRSMCLLISWLHETGWVLIISLKSTLKLRKICKKSNCIYYIGPSIGPYIYIYIYIVHILVHLNAPINIFPHLLSYSLSVYMTCSTIWEELADILRSLVGLLLLFSFGISRSTSSHGTLSSKTQGRFCPGKEAPLAPFSSGCKKFQAVFYSALFGSAGQCLQEHH